MKRVFWFRRLHKWLALVAGIQVSIWAFSGLYMTVVDLDIIHGDHLVKKQESLPIDPLLLVTISPVLMESIIPVQSIELKNYFGSAVYEIRAHKKNRVIVDAYTRELKTEVNEQQVRGNVAMVYAGTAEIISIEKLRLYPGEIGGKKLPVWRVVFGDSVASTLYFHHISGKLISKRTHLWRVFDKLWTLHIMDYFRSKGHQGYLFRFFSISSLLLAIFGSGLLFYRLRGEVK